MREEILVEKAVRVLIASLLEQHLGGSFWDSVQVIACEGEIQTNRVPLDELVFANAIL